MISFTSDSRFTVRSFSLTEMLMVMILSGILVGIVYYAYFASSTLFQDMSLKNQRHQEVSTLFFQLQKDIDHCKWLCASGKTDLICHFNDSTGIRYVFQKRFILRHHKNRMDTFHCETELPVVSWQSDSILLENTLVDRVSFILHTLEEEVPVSFQKFYDMAGIIEFTQTDTLRGRD